MKISDREKIMLCILGIIIMGFGYYNFVYSVQATAIEKKIKEEDDVKNKYETAKATIDSLDAKKDDANLLKSKILDKSQSFYPTISEEHIILEIDKMITDSGLKGSIKFDPIVSDSVESDNKKSTTLAESSLQRIVDEYNNKQTKSDDNTSKNNNDNANAITANTQNSNSSSNNSNSSQSKDNKKDTLQYVKLQVNFEGSYDAIDKFVNTIGQDERKIVINSIKLNSDSLKGIAGTINLEIYSIPKIDDDLQNYLKWNLNNTYGKNEPFALGTSNGSSSGISETNKKETSKTASSSDFLVSVKSIASDLPKVIIGKSKDDLRTTYVYGDSNSEEQAEMIFTQDGDKYYYKYKTSKESFPANYDGNGEEFIPMSKDIVLGIMSESRAIANDNSAIRLKIVNKTDRTIDVNINGDDAANPRVTIDGDSNVKVNKN